MNGHRFAVSPGIRRLSLLATATGLIATGHSVAVGCGRSSNGGGPTITEVRIVPVNAALTTHPGVPATLPLALEIAYASGASALAEAATWSGSTDQVGAVDETGMLSATGTTAGAVEVEARWLGWSARRTVPVYLSEATFLSGLDGSAETVLNSGPTSGPETAPAWEYPEEGTVFPVHFTPPLIQWSANGNTVYRLTLTRDEVSSIIYTRETEYQPSRAEWLALGAGHGAPLKLDLVGKTTLDANAPRAAAPTRTVTTADATLAGLLYYRRVEALGVSRADPSAGVGSTSLLTRPRILENCHGCHSASADGSRLLFAIWHDFHPTAAVSELVTPDPPAFESATVAPDPPSVRNGEALGASFTTFAPDGTYVAGVYYGRMWLAQVQPGAPLSWRADLPRAEVQGCTRAGINGALTTECAAYACFTPPAICNGTTTCPAPAGCYLPAHPSWSPDGTRLAYVARSDREDWAFTGADLMLMPWSTASTQFGDPFLLLPRGATTSTATLSYPSWSPDSRWLVVLSGPTTERNAVDSYPQLVDPSTGAVSVLMRGAPDGRTGHPAFTPFIEGGKYWIVFHSTRPYGHVTDRKQIWAMAVDTTAPAGMDPSHPAFWVPGQDTTTTNIQAIWTAPPCRSRGFSCAVAAECCTGTTCIETGGGAGACQPIAGCALPSESCSVDADCCPQAPITRCRPNLDGVLVCQITAPAL